jgi:predicted amidohydrolase
MGVRILLQVCYDLRFPVFARNTAKHPYDLALYVASWPTSRIEAWNTLLKARAIENQCYVAAVNRVGEDPACKYSGGTAFIDPYGHVVERCEDGRAQFITARVDMDALKAFREKFPVLKDADNL